MRRILAALFMVTFAGSASGQDFNTGKQAFERGDYVVALRAFRPLAEQGNANSQFTLGLMLAKGRGVPADYAEAAKWYRKAAAQSHALAQFKLGFMYANGQGVGKDYAEAIKWYRKAAGQGNAGAQFNLGVMYAIGQGVPQHYTEAVKWYRMAAEHGRTDAQANLGVMYTKGQGVPRDYILAHKWLNLAAAQGNQYAAKNRDYAEQRMTPADVSKAQRIALEWRPAKPERPPAQQKVAKSNSREVPRDDGKTVKPAPVVAEMAAEMAAEKSDASAQYRLGLKHALGEGVPQDYAKAETLWRLAAEQGHAGAQFNLGIMYDTGQGVRQSDAQAVRWYRPAAEQGDADAQFYLGAKHMSGAGIQKDFVRAHMWFSLAAAQGHKDATKFRDRISKQLSPAQISGSEHLARERRLANRKQIQTSQNQEPSKPITQAKSIQEISTSMVRSEQILANLQSWKVSETSNVIKFTTSGYNKSGHDFGFAKKVGQCDVDLLWLTWSSDDPDLHQLKGSEVQFTMNVDGTAFRIDTNILGTIELTSRWSFAVFSNYVATSDMVELLKRGRKLKIVIVSPSGAIKRFDIPSDTFSLYGYTASRARAQELCEKLEHDV